MEFITEYIEVITLAFCLCVGYIVKNVIPGDKVNRFIPLIVGILGVIVSVWVHGSFAPTVILAGLVSGLASTGLYEAFANFLKKGGGKNGD
ncbi:MAG: holin [Clostridia bacterium]|nr:holin [Clostridia bacterium]